MYICWNCEHQHHCYVTHCNACDAEHIDMILNTVRINRKELSQLLGQLPIQTGTLQYRNALVLEIQDEQVTVSLQYKVLLGRKFPKLQGITTFIDMDQFGGYGHGVSRRHAEFHHSRYNELALVDLSSANGTYLNGRKLAPHQPCQIHDGDQIYLGGLGFYIHFDEQ